MMPSAAARESTPVITEADTAMRAEALRWTYTALRLGQFPQEVTCAYILGIQSRFECGYPARLSSCQRYNATLNTGSQYQ